VRSPPNFGARTSTLPPPLAAPGAPPELPAQEVDVPDLKAGGLTEAQPSKRCYRDQSVVSRINRAHKGDNLLGIRN